MYNDRASMKGLKNKVGIVTIEEMMMSDSFEIDATYEKVF